MSHLATPKGRGEEGLGTIDGWQKRISWVIAIPIPNQNKSQGVVTAAKDDAQGHFSAEQAARI